MRAAAVRPALSKDHLGPTLPRTILRRRPKAKGLERIASGSIPKPDVDRESVANDALMSPTASARRRPRPACLDRQERPDRSSPRTGDNVRSSEPERPPRWAPAPVGRPAATSRSTRTVDLFANRCGAPIVKATQRSLPRSARQAPHFHNHGRTDRFWRAIEISERVG
jgi:hypothetical protein